jgi:transposase InsO family protein
MKGVIDRRMRGRRRSRAEQVARLGEDRRKFDAPDLRVIRHCVEHRRDQFFEEAAQAPRPGLVFDREVRNLLERARRDDGHALGWHRAHRLWRHAGLQLPRRRPRRRLASGRSRPLPAVTANFVWAYDFVFDACANGQQIKCLTIVDEYTRKCLAIDVAGSIRSQRVIEVLARLISTHGAPRYLRSDNGPEFVSRAILEWLQAQGIDTALIDPANRGKTAPTNRSTASCATNA